MLVATRSFDYVDQYTGPEQVIAGKTHVAEDHWLVAGYPHAWRVSEREDRVLDSVPAVDAQLLKADES